MRAPRAVLALLIMQAVAVRAAAQPTISLSSDVAVPVSVVEIAIAGDRGAFFVLAGSTVG